MTVKPTVSLTEHKARLDCIRADLDRRAETPSLSTEEMDEQLAKWRLKRGNSRPSDRA